MSWLFGEMTKSLSNELCLDKWQEHPYVLRAER